MICTDVGFFSSKESACLCLPVLETWVQSLGLEEPLKKEMAIHFSIPAWKIPWTEEPGSYSPQGHKESDMTEQVNNKNMVQI